MGLGPGASEASFQGCSELPAEHLWGRRSVVQQKQLSLDLCLNQLATAVLLRLLQIRPQEKGWIKLLLTVEMVPEEAKMSSVRWTEFIKQPTIKSQEEEALGKKMLTSKSKKLHNKKNTKTKDKMDV